MIKLTKLPTFRDAYRRRRRILPVDGFFEWKATKGKMKQPVAIAMRTGYPFGFGGMASGEWLRTFAIITTNEPWRRNSQPDAVLVSARRHDGDREHYASAG